MFIILHGDNQVASRQKLNELITAQKSAGVEEIIRLDGAKIDQNQLVQEAASTSLFGSNRLVVIESLFSRVKSQQKKALLQYLHQSMSDLPEIIIWEPKALTKTDLKSFTSVQIQEFKLTKTLFSFLDSLRPGNSSASFRLLEKTRQHEADELIFFMLVRQVRLLIQVKDQVAKLPPWQKQKLTRQANQFSTQQLISLHHQLLEIDRSIKTGKTLLPLSAHLDLLLAKL